MDTLPRGAKVVLALVWALALGALWLSPRPISPDAGLQIWLFPAMGLFALARMRSVDLSHTTKISLCCAVAFGLLLSLGPGVALWAALGGTLLAAVVPAWHCRCKWYQHLFNAANYVLSVAAAWWVYSQFPPIYPLGTTLENVAAIALAGLAFFVVNIGLLGAIVWLAQRQDRLLAWLPRFGKAALPYGGLLLVGGGFGVVASHSALASLAMLLPLLGVYSVLRTALAIRQDTKRALEALAQEIDNRDPYTAEHSKRVAHYVERMVRAMPYLSPEQADLVIRTARVHDVGKLVMPLELLHKPGRLCDEEWDLLKRHPLIGADLVSRFSDYRAGREIILHHHERYDGTGYPAALAGEAIPLGARIIAVADAFDAMTSNRSYRPALPVEKAIDEIDRQSGRQFDPEVVRVFVGEIGSALADLPSPRAARDQRESTEEHLSLPVGR